MLERFFSTSKKEQEVILNIKKHIKTLITASQVFKNGFEKENQDIMLNISELEREADSIRRGLISRIYEGAFLPYLRPNIFRFVEIIDEAFDVLKDAASEYKYIKIKSEELKSDCAEIININCQICEMLLQAVDSMFFGEDLREKSLAIRIYEKKIDEIKLEITEKLQNIDVESFWEGKMLSDFISHLSKVSDIIEDASDYLNIIKISLK
ncbi:MAG: TIGR00153 family protein [Thermodesulfovibrionales bacterium]|nr:TIGR00153 family protein [Thermodesulfovibrionales bacterium]